MTNSVPRTARDHRHQIGSVALTHAQTFGMPRTFSASTFCGLRIDHCRRHRPLAGRHVAAMASLALLLDRPQPVGFILVGIIACRRRYQLRALLAEVIEATAHRLALQRVLIEGVVRYLRREVLKQ